MAVLRRSAELAGGAASVGLAGAGAVGAMMGFGPLMAAAYAAG